MSLIHIAARLRYADKDWQRFLDQKYEGGKKKVLNPNQATSKRYPEVTVNHAMKDEHYRKHIQEEYEQWKGSERVNPGAKTVSTEPIKTVYEPHKALLGEHTVDGMLEQYKDYFRSVSLDDLESDSQYKLSYESSLSRIQDLSGLDATRNSDSYTKEKISKVLNMFKRKKVPPNSIYGYSKYFNPEVNTEKIIHRDTGAFVSILDSQVDRWMGSSSNASSQVIQRYLTKNGVKGSRSPKDSASLLQPYNELFGQEAKMESELSKAYAYQQAVFKHLGITHITLYRGIKEVNADGYHEPTLKSGDKAKIKSRPASSWTSNPEVGTRFGSRLLTCEVPVEQILMSPTMNIKLDGEGAQGSMGETEFVVIGAEDMECTVF